MAHTKMFTKNFLFIFSVILSLFAFTSCGGNDPDEPEISKYPLTPDTPLDDDDETKYEIVGTWEAQYKWTYSNVIQTIVLEIFRNETYSFVSTSTNDPTPFPGSGKWSYNKDAHSWHLGATSNSMIPGDYILVNGQLILYVYFDDGSSRTIIYNRKNGSGNSGTDTGDTQSKYLKTLLNHKTWSWYKSSYDNGFFTFYDTNQIQFVNSGKSNVGSYGVPVLDARGRFTISGSTLTASYSSVSVDPSLTSSEMSKHFPGWSVGSAKTVRYTIKSLNDEALTITDGSKTWNLEPLF